ncbi:hypothetical protein FPV67DRAFT_1426687, partial [Lyophyllum atratum]
SSAPTSRAASPSPTEPSSIPPAQSGAHSTAKRKSKDTSHARRRRKRQRQSDAASSAPNAVRPGVRAKFLSSSVPVHTDAEPEGFQVASSGFIGVRSTPTPRVLSTAQLLRLSNLRPISWSGKVPKPLLDCSSRVVGVFAGQPDGESWSSTLAKAVTLLEKARAEGTFSQKQLHHSRGKFPTLASGFAHGGGRAAPCNLKPYNSTNALLINKLLQEPAFERLATFSSSVFATWAPKLYAEYVKCMDELCTNDPTLKRNWPRSAFAAAVFNLGPQTICYRHKDFANLPYGWCAVTALGSFNPKLGGHIILWELGLIVEFPAGSTVLFPSAVVEHFNTPVQAHESRYSFTQYSAGGLFRWAEHGMKSDKDFFQDLSEEDFNHAATKAEQRWEHGLSLFSTLTELKSCK